MSIIQIPKFKLSTFLLIAYVSSMLLEKLKNHRID